MTRRGYKKADNQGKTLEELEKEEEDGKGCASQGELHKFKEDEKPDRDDDNGSDPSRKSNEETLNASLMDMVLRERVQPALRPNGLPDSDMEEEEEKDEEAEGSNVSDADGLVSSEDLHYVFDKMIFTNGKVIITIHHFVIQYTITKHLLVLFEYKLTSISIFFSGKMS